MTLIEKAGLYFSIFIIIVLLSLIIFSKNGVLDYHKLEQDKVAMQDRVNIIESKNQKIEKEIISLKTDMDYIKHLAKHEHDMAEEGELIFKDKPANRGN
jgi:cell division protein FtsB